MAGKTEVTASPGGREVMVTRVVNAPREKVWEAYNNPDLLKQWLGPRDLKMTIEKFDMKAGGSYHFTHIDKYGNKFGFNGVIHGVYPPEKAIQTFEFEGLPEPGHVSLDTLTLEDLGNGTTKITTISVFQTVEDRDAMVQSGMESGITEGFERLDELLAKA
jgi:uncharacterized protein YndB with AHSA1/START domain